MAEHLSRSNPFFCCHYAAMTDDEYLFCSMAHSLEYYIYDISSWPHKYKMLALNFMAVPNCQSYTLDEYISHTKIYSTIDINAMLIYKMFTPEDEEKVQGILNNLSPDDIILMSDNSYVSYIFMKYKDSVLRLNTYIYPSIFIESTGTREIPLTTFPGTSEFRMEMPSGPKDEFYKLLRNARGYLSIPGRQEFQTLSSGMNEIKDVATYNISVPILPVPDPDLEIYKKYLLHFLEIKGKNIIYYILPGSEEVAKKIFPECEIRKAEDKCPKIPIGIPLSLDEKYDSRFGPIKILEV